MPTAETTTTAAVRACDGGLARAFNFLGKRWSGLILGILQHGGASFSELSRAIEGISDSMLSGRLTELTQAGLVTRTVCPGPPVTVVYALTASGRDLVPALEELSRWARANLSADAAC